MIDPTLALTYLTRTRDSTSVKRVVITASCASVLKPSATPAVWAESSWNAPAIEEVKEKGAATPAMVVYRASKTLAEKGLFLFLVSVAGVRLSLFRQPHGNSTRKIRIAFNGTLQFSIRLS